VKNYCGASFEDAIHYFLECPLYLNERRTLLSNCDDININIETLLFGNDKYSYDVNSRIFGKVRTFINQSKKDNVGEYLIDMFRLFQSETLDGINELADVLSLHLT
jgi:hypothetical protein